ncbi:MAG: methyltransferase domain-containing protein [Rickettsia endosymbiont of Gnoriste bilineata]|nr:methyltransferase domain-containing protein [Rickettsia endosymbiont of Gnoriste bilineata]
MDSRRCEKYSLRQSRYYVISRDVSRIVSEIKSKNQRVKLLDIGVASGVSRRYIENQPNNEVIDYYGADIEIRDDIYKKESYSCLYQADLMQGMLNVPSNIFDIIICEQVLEHLDELELAFKSIERVLKPGGTLFLGVPIFPHGIHLVRQYLVPLIDKICREKKLEVMFKHFHYLHLQNYFINILNWKF